jgi:hypothetical protein
MNLPNTLGSVEPYVLIRGNRVIDDTGSKGR